MPIVACSSGYDNHPSGYSTHVACAVRLSRLQQTARDNVKTHSRVFKHMTDQDMVGAVSNKVRSRNIAETLQ